jgi:S1-C subfamily serine protease
VTRTKISTKLTGDEKTARRRALCALGAVGIGVILTTACGDDAPAAEARPPALVSIETQRCRQPNRFHGVGIVVGDDLVLTAGHLAEGALRALSVDGEPARVVTIDRRSDLALLDADVPTATPPTPSPQIPDEAQLLVHDDTRDVSIDRHVTLVVEHASDRATYRRDVVIFSPGVADGESGSPIVDDSGRLVGIVIADQEGEGVAVTADEVAELLGAVSTSDDLGLPGPPGTC